MKKRYLYAVLFGLPGFFISALVAILVFGALMGVLWLFVLGDNPWPLGVESLSIILFVVVLLIGWITFIIIGYQIGRRLEQEPQLKWGHILISGGLTLLLMGFIIVQQWHVGNLGPRSAMQVCSDYCVQQGYAGSGMPPQNSGDNNCSCYDHSGHEVLKIPLEQIDPSRSK